jgi:hypothetical protein
VTTSRHKRSSAHDLQTELLNRAVWLVQHDAPEPALWLLVELMRSLSNLTEWTADLDAEEHETW